MIRWYGDLIDQPLKKLSAILQRFNFNSIHVLVVATVEALLSLRCYRPRRIQDGGNHPREVRPEGELRISVLRQIGPADPRQ